jgi:hypothetical protein
LKGKADGSYIEGKEILPEGQLHLRVLAMAQQMKSLLDR